MYVLHLRDVDDLMSNHAASCRHLHEILHVNEFASLIAITTTRLDRHGSARQDFHNQVKDKVQLPAINMIARSIECGGNQCECFRPTVSGWTAVNVEHALGHRIS